MISFPNKIKRNIVSNFIGAFSRPFLRIQGMTNCYCNAMKIIMIALVTGSHSFCLSKGNFEWVHSVGTAWKELKAFKSEDWYLLSLLFGTDYWIIYLMGLALESYKFKEIEKHGLLPTLPLAILPIAFRSS